MWFTRTLHLCWAKLVVSFFLILHLADFSINSYTSFIKWIDEYYLLVCSLKKFVWECEWWVLWKCLIEFLVKSSVSDVFFGWKFFIPDLFSLMVTEQFRYFIFSQMGFVDLHFFGIYNFGLFSTLSYHLCLW